MVDTRSTQAAATRTSDSAGSKIDPYSNIQAVDAVDKKLSEAISHAMKHADGRGFVLAKLKGKSPTVKQSHFVSSISAEYGALSNSSYQVGDYKNAISALIDDAIEANNITQFRMYYKLYRSAGFKLSKEQKEDLEKAAAFSARAAMLEETEKYHVNERIFSAGEIVNETVDTADDILDSFYNVYDKIRDGIGRGLRWAIHSRIVGGAVALFGIVFAGYQLKSALSAASNIYDYLGAGSGFGETAGTSVGYGFMAVSKLLAVTPLIGSVVLLASAISGVVSSAMEYLSLRKEYREAKELLNKDAGPEKVNKLAVAKVLMNTAGKKAIAGVGLSLVFLAAAVAFVFPAVVGALLGGLSTLVVYGLCIGAGVLATGMKWLAGKFFDRTEEKALARIEADDPTNHPEVHLRPSAECAAAHSSQRPQTSTTLHTSVDTVFHSEELPSLNSDSEQDDNVTLSPH